MAQREAVLTRKIRKALELEWGSDIFLFKVWGSEHMMAGLPDLIGCVKGRFFGLEVKLPESAKNTSARQDLVHTLIRSAGGHCEVVTTVAGALAAIGAAAK